MVRVLLVIWLASLDSAVLCSPVHLTIGTVRFFLSTSLYLLTLGYPSVIQNEKKIIKNDKKRVQNEFQRVLPGITNNPPNCSRSLTPWNFCFDDSKYF